MDTISACPLAKILPKGVEFLAAAALDRDSNILLRHFRRVDAVDGDQGDVDLRFHALRDPREGATWHHGGNRGNSSLHASI